MKLLRRLGALIVLCVAMTSVVPNKAMAYPPSYCGPNDSHSHTYQIDWEQGAYARQGNATVTPQNGTTTTYWGYWGSWTC